MNSVFEILRVLNFFVIFLVNVYNRTFKKYLYSQIIVSENFLQEMVLFY